MVSSTSEVLRQPTMILRYSSLLGRRAHTVPALVLIIEVISPARRKGARVSRGVVRRRWPGPDLRRVSVGRRGRRRRRVWLMGRRVKVLGLLRWWALLILPLIWLLAGLPAVSLRRILLLLILACSEVSDGIQVPCGRNRRATCLRSCDWNAPHPFARSCQIRGLSGQCHRPGQLAS